MEKADVGNEQSLPLKDTSEYAIGELSGKVTALADAVAELRRWVVGLLGCGIAAALGVYFLLSDDISEAEKVLTDRHRLTAESLRRVEGLIEGSSDAVFNDQRSAESLDVIQSIQKEIETIKNEIVVIGQEKEETDSALKELALRFSVFMEQARQAQKQVESTGLSTQEFIFQEGSNTWRQFTSEPEVGAAPSLGAD